MAIGIHHSLIITALSRREIRQDAHPFATDGPPANDTLGLNQEM
jgi:hypothetical protein